MNELKKRFNHLSVLKELPAELSERHPTSDDGMWVWASRELIDSSGDLVLSDGISFSEFHNPQEGIYLKVLAQHLRELPDGTAPVLGLVKDFMVLAAPFKNRMVKGLAVWFEWLKDKDGQLLPLARQYKEMVDAGGIDQCSIGITASDYEPMTNTGGWLIRQCSIFELSLVTIAANQGASLLKQQTDPSSVELHKKIDTLSALIPTTLASFMKSVQTRLEVIESGLVVLSHAANPAKDNPKGSPETSNALQTLKEQLERTLLHLT